MSQFLFALSTCGITGGIYGHVVGVDRWLECYLLLYLSRWIRPPLNLISGSSFPSQNRIGHRGSYEMVGSITAVTAVKINMEGGVEWGETSRTTSFMKVSLLCLPFFCFS